MKQRDVHGMLRCQSGSATMLDRPFLLNAARQSGLYKPCAFPPDVLIACATARDNHLNGRGHVVSTQLRSFRHYTRHSATAFAARLVSIK